MASRAEFPASHFMLSFRTSAGSRDRRQFLSRAYAFLALCSIYLGLSASAFPYSIDTENTNQTIAIGQCTGNALIYGFSGGVVYGEANIIVQGSSQALNWLSGIAGSSGYTVSVGEFESICGLTELSFEETTPPDTIISDEDTMKLVFSAREDDSGLSYRWELSIVAPSSDAIPVVTLEKTLLDATPSSVGLAGAMMELRSRLILDHGPDSQRRLNRLNGDHGGNGAGLAYADDTLPFALTLGRDSASFAYSRRNARAASGTQALAMFGGTDPTGAAVPVTERYDVWVEGQFSKFNAAPGDGTFAILHAGADYLVTEDFLLGLGTQFDWIDMDAASGTGSADGWGFMVGPYMTARIAEGLYFDARGAWGQSHNHVSPLGTYEDPFDGTRWLATAALIGEFEAGEFTVSPEARLSWFREQSDAYVDSLMVPIPSVTTETGTFAFGPTISRKIAMEEGSVMTPFATLSAVWTFAQRNTATAFSGQPGLAEEGIRAKVEAGLDFADDNGLRFSVSGHYDGIGDSGYEAYGGKANLSKAF